MRPCSESDIVAFYHFKVFEKGGNAMKEKCIGDNHNIECPYCGKLNHYVVGDVRVVLGNVTYFIRPCRYCAQTVHYYANYRIALEAFRKNPALSAAEKDRSFGE
jgi:uncharacterized Zn-finger protein